jgi:UDP-glucose:(heptosyl)LPS alpha-1,3-glucosyltransferase
MKIVLCADHFSGQGGQENFLRSLAAFLVTRGHAVTVLATRGDSLPGVTFKVVPIPAACPRSARAWASGRALAQALRHEEYDVSFGGQKTWDCAVLRPGGGVETEYWQRHLRGVAALLPTITAGLFPLKRFFDILCERRGYNSSRLKTVIVNSHMVAQSLARHFPAAASKAVVIYNGADVARFDPANAERWRAGVAASLGLDGAMLTGVFAAHNFRLKGLRQAIEAIALAGRGPAGVKAQLIVLGSGRPSAYARLARSLGIQNGVRFAGSVTDAERYYAAADFLLFPSFYDPCANVTLEALAAGLPVLTTALNGAHELLTQGRDGWIVADPRDVRGLADGIVALHDPEQRRAVRQAARETALQHPIESKLAAIETVLRAVASGNRGD